MGFGTDGDHHTQTLNVVTSGAGHCDCCSVVFMGLLFEAGSVGFWKLLGPSCLASGAEHSLLRGNLAMMLLIGSWRKVPWEL